MYKGNPGHLGKLHNAAVTAPISKGGAALKPWCDDIPARHELLPRHLEDPGQTKKLLLVPVNIVEEGAGE